MKTTINDCGCSIEDASDQTKFTYVDVVSPGCEGWLNLFFGDQIICLVDNKKVAEQMRLVLDEKQWN